MSRPSPVYPHDSFRRRLRVVPRRPPLGDWLIATGLIAGLILSALVFLVFAFGLVLLLVQLGRDILRVLGG